MKKKTVNHSSGPGTCCVDDSNLLRVLHCI